jgi:TetR/AcrR family transcriptional repressor of nem operon
VIVSTLGDASLKADKAIAAFFDKVVISVPAKQRPLGCLLVNSVCESIIWNADVQKLLRDSLNVIRKALFARTRELEKSKGLARGMKADLAADVLLTLYEGLNVAARSGKAPRALADQLEFTLKAVSK